MEIYNKNHFAMGLFWLVIALGLFLNDGAGDLLKWLVAIAFAVKFFHSALSKAGNAAAERRRVHYEEAATALYGRHYALRTNLPLLVLLPFLVLAFVLRFGFAIWLPVWLYVADLLVATVAAFYSIGVERRITEHIEAKYPLEDSEERAKEPKKEWDPEC